MVFASLLQFTELCALALVTLKNILHIDEEESFQIEISLREAVNNAIVHGNLADPEKLVHLRFTWEKHRLEISVRDENPTPLDWQAIEASLNRRDLLSCNGRGLLIMRNYMDRVEFRHRDGGNEVILEKKLA